MIYLLGFFCFVVGAEETSRMKHLILQTENTPRQSLVKPFENAVMRLGQHLNDIDASQNFIPQDAVPLLHDIFNQSALRIYSIRIANEIEIPVEQKLFSGLDQQITPDQKLKLKKFYPILLVSLFWHSKRLWDRVVDAHLLSTTSNINLTAKNLNLTSSAVMGSKMRQIFWRFATRSPEVRVIHSEEQTLARLLVDIAKYLDVPFDMGSSCTAALTEVRQMYSILPPTTD